MKKNKKLSQLPREELEKVFYDIVSSYQSMVYSTALRRLGKHDLAEDAAQATFLILFKKIRKINIGKGVMLSVWLWRTVMNVSKQMIEKDIRRKKYEQAAFQPVQENPDFSWREVVPELDQVLQTLPSRSREAIIAHYYMNKGYQEIASELDIKPDTVRKRIEYGVAKLRKKLSKQGVAVSVTLLGSLLTTRAIQAAPAGFCDATVSAALQLGTGGFGYNVNQTGMGRVADLARNTMHMMMWEKVKMYIALFILTLTAGITGYVLLDHLADSYRAQSAAAVDVILDAYSNWRYFVVRGSDQIITDTGDLEPLHIVDPSARFASVHGKKDLKEIYHTDLPDAGWKGREFDDSSWPRSQTDIGYAFRLGRYQDYQPGYFSAPFICMRGKFMVEDPERMGDMFLSADFNGGVVVYINGKEAGRAYMPKGEIEWPTPAEEYPSKAYFTPDNNPLEHKYRSPDAMRLPERFSMRTRRIRHLRIPSTMLCRGINVIAIGNHRAPAPDSFLNKKRFQDYGFQRRSLWNRIGILKINLFGEKGRAAHDTRRKEDLHIWNHPVVSRVYVTASGDPNEQLRPVRISGVRNGSFSGQFVIESTKDIRGVRIEKTAFEGTERIPGTAIQIRYAKPDGNGRPHRNRPDWFDSLEQTPPPVISLRKDTHTALIPVWVTVHIPSDADPGIFKGRLIVRTDNSGPFEVPIHLNIFNWTLPDTKAFSSYIGMVQSPESVALRYDAEMWSEEHWDLLDRSFELMGQAGADALFLTLIRRTQFGNRHGMVRWIRQPDESLKPDLSIAEKYIETAVAHLGNIRVVCLYCWEPVPLPVSVDVPGKRTWKDRDILYSIYDPKTGKLEEATGPQWGTEECRRFWQPAFDGIRDILARHGIEGSMMAGISGDYLPSKACVEDIAAVSSGIKWVSHAHNFYSAVQGIPIGCCTNMWGMTGIRNPGFPLEYSDQSRFYGWKENRMIIARILWKIRAYKPILYYRIEPEKWMVGAGRLVKSTGVYTGTNGIGRIGADFWPVISDRRGRLEIIPDRYLGKSDGGQLALRSTAYYMLGPGRDGPVSTVRFEMLRENIQEIEARVFLERILANPEQCAKLGPDLSERCQSILDERVRDMLRIKNDLRYDITWYMCVWQKRSEALYHAAAEAAKILGIE